MSHKTQARADGCVKSRMLAARSDARERMECRAVTVSSGGDVESICTMDFRTRTDSVTVDSIRMNAVNNLCIFEIELSYNLRRISQESEAPSDMV